MCDDIAYDGIKVLALKWGQNLFEIASFQVQLVFFLFILIYPRLKSNLFGVLVTINLLDLLTNYSFEYSFPLVLRLFQYYKQALPHHRFLAGKTTLLRPHNEHVAAANATFYSEKSMQDCTVIKYR